MQLSLAITKDMSPLMMHLGMFVPTIIGQGTLEQQAKWLLRALNVEILGTYVQVNRLKIILIILNLFRLKFIIQISDGAWSRDISSWLRNNSHIRPRQARVHFA